MVISRKSLILMTLAVIFTASGAYWMLITPSNPLTRLFQREISDIDARIVIGPYPSEHDLDLLKSHGVTLIVSLLNPAIPYEASLLETEQVLARQKGLQLLNFPMSSILGQRFGNSYDESAGKAAAAIRDSPAKVYLHCYLGVHRIQAVRKLLAAQGVQAGTYAVRKGEREETALATDTAEAAYAGGRYQDALDAIAKVDENRLSDSAKILRAWSHYRLGHIKIARDLFQQFVTANPGHPQASIGLGYCAYREDDFVLAEQQFTSALKHLPDNADALGGLGLTYWRVGRLDEAAVQLDAAMKIAPGNNELRAVRARVNQPR